jgi:hypothetical protein
MRIGCAHEAEADISAGGDERVLGGAVTDALCGRFDCGPGECRWPHHTAVLGRDGDRVRVRVVFACEPGEEAAVRGRITAALAAGSLPVRADAGRWTLIAHRPVPVDPADEALAGRLVTN